jgi:hypothetical protein
MQQNPSDKDPAAESSRRVFLCWKGLSPQAGGKLKTAIIQSVSVNLTRVPFLHPDLKSVIPLTPFS